MFTHFRIKNLMRVLTVSACITALIVLILAGCGHKRVLTWGLAKAPSSHDNITGDYYTGDGLGVNITLKLNNDSTYNVEWHGCLGRYGGGSGRWSVEDTLLILNPVTETGLLVDLFRTLIIQRHKNEWILVETDEIAQEFYYKYGISKSTCFQKTDVLFPRIQR